MVRKSAILVLLLLPALAAQGPAPSAENITVTGTKSREVIDNFVKSFAVPTRLTGKMARWETPICPYAAGVQPEANDFVVKRLKEIAAEVGAPVSSDPSCKFNIEIVFTRTPQALLDNIKRDQPELLGYFDSSKERDQLAAVTRPIQAWYTTATRDLRGRTEIDSSRAAGNGKGLTVIVPCNMVGDHLSATMMCVRTNPYARKINVTGATIADGVRSMFDDIIVVVDPGKLTELELGAVSDYIAMLALTELAAPGACRQLPSIADLLAEGCDGNVNALTPNDFAYLRGLYRANSGMEAQIQKNEIANQMERAIADK